MKTSFYVCLLMALAGVSSCKKQLTEYNPGVTAMRYSIRPLVLRLA
ncbi:hypothetical protein [Pseudobacter ginsenosidimutans]|nr:hypothetical protein [Pseudobacter ginsenosidimutans]